MRRIKGTIDTSIKDKIHHRCGSLQISPKSLSIIQCHGQCNLVLYYKSNTSHQAIISKPFSKCTFPAFDIPYTTYFAFSTVTYMNFPGSLMSATGLSDRTKAHRKLFHLRKESEELDVFEAARYFSGYSEASGCINGASYTRKVNRGDHRQPCRGGRMSLDVPPMMYHQQSQQSHVVDKQILKEKKHKQPSSPGARLASFLNSLFTHTGSKKKKKKSKSTTQSMKDEDESPGGRRKRRSSISHFQSWSTINTKSPYLSSTSGFRTPPPYSHTSAKSYTGISSNSDRKHAISMSKHNGNPKFKVVQTEGLYDKRNQDLTWMDEKLKFHDRFSDKPKNHSTKHVEKYGTKDGGRNSSKQKEYRKFAEVEDGAESDSSSDLFELQSYDLGIFSSGLPVYETTHMDGIRMDPPISAGAP